MPVLLPTRVDDAVDALARHPDAMVLAGGTDLLIDVNAGRRRPQSVVALRRVDELQTVQVGTHSIRIGAGVTYSRMLDDEIAMRVPALAQAARTVGSPQIRNAGTIGGNLGTASPAGDTLPVLLALGAGVELAGPAGSRKVPIADFLVGPKRTDLQPGELIVAVTVPVVPGRQEFRKVGVRNAMVIAIASVALVLDTERRTVAVGLGSVGPVALRAPAAETWIAARLSWAGTRPRLDEAGDAAQFGAMVAEEATPIDDHRGTAAYRAHAVSILAARCLRAVIAEDRPA